MTNLQTKKWRWRIRFHDLAVRLVGYLCHILPMSWRIILKFNSDWNWQKEKIWKNVLEKESYGATGVIAVIGIVKKRLFLIQKYWYSWNIMLFSISSFSWSPYIGSTASSLISSRKIPNSVTRNFYNCHVIFSCFCVSFVYFTNL